MPVVKHIVQPVLKKVVEHEEPANYDFEYAVHDDHTGDIKEHHESAKNGAVEGYYTLIDADGYRRIVHYTADDAHGFVAEVRREKIEGHQVVKNVQPVVVKKVIAQPAIAVQKYVAPAPVHQYYSAPETQYYKTEVQQPQQYYNVVAPVKVAVAQPVVQKYVAPVVTKVVSSAPAYDNNHDFSSHQVNRETKLSIQTMNSHDEEVLRLNKKIKQLIWQNEQNMSRSSQLMSENMRLSMTVEELKQISATSSSLNVKYKLQLEQEINEKEALQEANHRLKSKLNKLAVNCNELNQRVKVLEANLKRKPAIRISQPHVQVVESVSSTIQLDNAAFIDLQNRFDKLEAEHNEALNVIDELEFELGDIDYLESETQRLKQENAELKQLLQNSSNSQDESTAYGQDVNSTSDNLRNLTLKYIKYLKKNIIMASKFIALFALIAVASAQHYHNDYYQQQPQYHQYQAPALIKSVQPALIKSVQPALIKSYQPAVVKQIVQPTYVKQVAHEEPANYEFNYDVHDPHTGDIKQQHEHAHDGAIQGQYSLIDADGYRRIVAYTADDHHGFQANVRREPVEGHKVVKTVQKVIAQPAIAVQKYIQPAQPIAVQKYIQPAQQYVSAPVQQQYYSAPAQTKYTVAQPIVQKYVSAPVVQKYVSAPVVQKYVAPAPQYYSAPAQVIKTVAQPIKYSTSEQSSHVSFHGPSSQYHY
ncbi:CLUMA_CG013833, isoform A [Clunio marinus]|uniref:CLUMA_CG013833, isoform A n=1 Tax=Clunio marinus TaxID=568069 RepID=A0A1J1IK00_9DIPT|nr:CLUMA_CG013833, isoform A [Clunio marinus]